MPEWSPEYTVDEALARRLIAGQCFQPRTLRPLGAGWDNTVWLADERWVFRFPRRAIALPGVRRELAVLGGLAPRLPLPIPVPRFAGEPADGYPWPFSGAELIPGRELPEAPLTHEQRCALGRPLGEFLRALHDAPVPAELPDDPMGRADMARRVPRTRAALREAEALWPAPPAVHELLDAAAALRRPPASVLVHGDLHFRHVLVHGGVASGVIDWGDVCRGDPAVDLALCWCALPAEGRAEFFAAYGPVSESQTIGARVLALCLCAVLLVYGVREGFGAVAREARAGLERASGEAERVS